jgi:hypothetical protein
MASPTRKFIRDNFYEKISTPVSVGGGGPDVLVNDVLSFKFVDFANFLRGQRVVRQRITDDTEATPDLLSYGVYRTTEFWWVVMVANAIDDCFQGFVEGDQLVIPPVALIEQFFSQVTASDFRGTVNV